MELSMSALITTIELAVAALGGFLFSSVHSGLESRRMRVALDRIRWVAEHDSLTALPNRILAERHYQLEEAAGRRCVVVLLDLDEFKSVNDTWGHEIGDAHLSTVAERLAEACEPIGAMASRLAGDEFLLLLPDSDRGTVDNLVRAILAHLSRQVTLAVGGFIATAGTPSASAGIALPAVGSTWADQLRCADIALYRAKAHRGQHVFYAPGMAFEGVRLRELKSVTVRS